jgi:hypothetical protein
MIELTRGNLFDAIPRVLISTRWRGITEGTVFHQVSKKAASASVAGSAAARTYRRGIAGVGPDAENYGSIQCGRVFDRGAQWRERLEDAGNISHTSTDVLARSIRRPSRWPARIAWDALRRARGSALHSREEDYR